MSSDSLRPDGEPAVTATLAGEDEIYEISPRYGSVQLKGLTLEAQEVLSRFDLNGDGEVDEVELEGVIDVLVKEQFKGRLFLCGILLVAFALAVLLASIFGMTWAVVSLHKDTVLRGQVIIARESGDPLQSGDNHFQASKSGALVSRSDQAVLGTFSLYRKRPLNANMTAYLLNTLTRVHANATNGAQVGFKVTGYAVLAPPNSPRELHISTPSGVLVLVGDQVSSCAAAEGLLDELDELLGQSVIGIFAA